VILFIADAKKEGINLLVVETYRSPLRQAYVKKRGRSTLTVSKHQYGLAIDVVPIVKGKAQWNNYKMWNKLKVIGRKYGFICGGDWKRFKDHPHFEYRCNISGLDTLKIPNKVIIPI
jgi:hypothetical protein